MSDAINPRREPLKAHPSYESALEIPTEDKGVAPARKLSLYEIEENLLALADSVETVAPEQEAEFIAEFHAAMEAAKDKRDRVHYFLDHCETMAEAAKREAARLSERAKRFTAAKERVEKMVVPLIEMKGFDKKGKPVGKLEGTAVTFTLARKPRSLEIVNEAEVPDRYKNVTIEMRKDHFEVLMGALDMPSLATLEPLIQAKKVTVSASDVKKDLDDEGNGVPGAKLSTVQYRVVRK